MIRALFTVVLMFFAAAGFVCRGVGAIVTTDAEIGVLGQQASAAMDSTQIAVTACAAMTPTDVAQWAGIYSAWTAYYAQLKACLTGTNDFEPPTVQCMATFGFTWSATGDKLRGVIAQAAVWQQKVHNACPNYNPPPGPVPTPTGAPATPSTWVEDLSTVAKIVGGGAVALALVYGLYRATQVVSDYTEAGIAKHAVRRIMGGKAKSNPARHARY